MDRVIKGRKMEKAKPIKEKRKSNRKFTKQQDDFAHLIVLKMRSFLGRLWEGTVIYPATE